MNKREVRNIRLKNDYYELMSISGYVVEVKPVKGKPPFISEYEITYRIKTIHAIKYGIPMYRNVSIVRMIQNESYPDSAPFVQMISMPPPHHPNWFPNGTLCPGIWTASESITHYVYRIGKTLQFHPSYSNPSSPANSEAAIWYNANKSNKNLIPCDHQELPTIGEIKPIYIVSIS